MANDASKFERPKKRKGKNDVAGNVIIKEINTRNSHVKITCGNKLRR